MRDVDDALAILARTAGFAALAFDRNGNAALTVNGDIPVYLMKIDEYHLELVTRIDQLRETLPAYTLRMLLSANAAGRATGAGRLAIDPAAGTVHYETRVDVRALDDQRFLAHFTDFVRMADYWRSPGSAALLTGSLPGAVSTSTQTDSYFRG